MTRVGDMDDAGWGVEKKLAPGTSIEKVLLRDGGWSGSITVLSERDAKILAHALNMRGTGYRYEAVRLGWVH